ncbi:hypothetical protein ACFXHA_45260 [Nocardia sp. NPDC059240]|uniref:hypothetical protein n=1 Tax=Nocardia sp. NPDC059240 TaxID=3346786 RepID=UPI0036A2C106
MSEQPEIVEQIITPAGRNQTSATDRPPRAGEAEIPPRMRAFVEQLTNGQLPDPGEVPEQDPQVLALAAELQIVHLPEWRNPAGRVLAGPATTQIPAAVRIAEYLVRRGVRVHPELEQIRWIPTPNGPPRAYDDGLHVTPDEHGQWPDPDPETFWDVADIAVRQERDGSWIAVHPRGIQFTALSKSAAYAGLVERLRAKIEEAQQHG